MGPLDGIKVIEVAAIVMAPFASQMLGDMGAEIIKVEPPEGDSIRAVGPMHSHGMGPMYFNSNRNKRSIVLDLKKPQGREALLRLARDADALLYNVRPQAMARLGLAYEDLRQVNPGLVYVGAFGFGQSGPYAARPAFDELIQGLVALPSLMARSGNGTPRYVPLAFIDRYVGVNVAASLLAALLHRQRTGEGQAIEVPMLEVAAQLVLADHMGGATYDPPLGPAGYPRSLASERRPFATQDGYICAMLYTDRHWRSFLGLVGRPELMEDARFGTLTARTVHAGEVHGALEDMLRTRTTAEWLAAFEKIDIPAFRLNTLESLLEDPHLQAVDMFSWHDHPTEGRVRAVRPPTTWSRTPPSIRRLPPRIGEHSGEILAEAGYSPEEIAALAANGATRLGD